MREILFRGYNYQYQKWFYGSLIIKNYEGSFMLSDTETIIVDDRLNQVVVDRSTIGQYTGLTDKNGKKIFEGDKVMFDYDWTKPNEVGVITWNESNSSFQIKGHIPSSSMKHLNQMKVIGNIFDKEVKDANTTN